MLAGIANVAACVPRRVHHVVAVAHGYPWADGSRTDREISDYTEWIVSLWRDFATANSAMVIAPPLGTNQLGDYRGAHARTGVSADAYLTSIVDQFRSRHAPDLARGDAVVGHSAGAQFASRYLVLHPRRVEVAVISAPSTFPFPSPDAEWPAGSANAPEHADWLAAACTPTYVCVGSRDTEVRPPSTGQRGATRQERAAAWTSAMNDLAAAAGKVSRVRMDIVGGTAHDEQDMSAHMQQVLDRYWRVASSKSE